MLSRIEHIALAVSDLDAAIALYTSVWGLEVEHREVVEDQQVEEAMLRLGETYIQLLAPTSEDSPIAKFINKRGEGMHHIAFAVDDLEAALANLRSAGARLIDEQPRRGSRDTKIAFIHPQGNRGVLVELVEVPDH